MQHELDLGEGNQPVGKETYITELDGDAHFLTMKEDYVFGKDVTPQDIRKYRERRNLSADEIIVVFDQGYKIVYSDNPYDDYTITGR